MGLLRTLIGVVQSLMYVVCHLEELKDNEWDSGSTSLDLFRLQMLFPFKVCMTIITPRRNYFLRASTPEETRLECYLSMTLSQPVCEHPGSNRLVLFRGWVNMLEKLIDDAGATGAIACSSLRDPC
jgi:hypothetical protein